MFLPALLLTKIGSELHSGSAHRYLIVLIWAFICHLISFIIGYSAHLVLGFPDWITAAILFNNTTSYPLLLVQSLDETGILSHLIVTDETTRDAIERAKSYFLVFATVSSCLTFAVGPRLIDCEHAPDSPTDDKDEAILDPEPDSLLTNEDVEVGIGEPSTEQTSLLAPGAQENIMMPFERRAYGISPQRWLDLHPHTRWVLLFLYDFLNAPLLGAVLGTIIGLVPVLHRAFFNDTTDGGIFSAWLTVSLHNIGQLFVPLPVIIAGVSLYTSMRKPRRRDAVAPGAPLFETIFILLVRFVIWPVVSISAIHALATKTNLLSTDPMLWFTMMLMPTGPPAMKLIAMVQVSNGDEEEETKIAKLLTVY